MDISNFMPGGQSSTNVDYGNTDWAETFGQISAGGGFGLGSLMSLLASKPQFIVKGENGKIEFQSMLETSVDENTNLPNEPIEQGTFATYNRIIEPIEIKCRLAAQGYPSSIQAMLDRLRELKEGTEKVTFIIPEASYENLMLQSFDYRKDNHNGYNVLQVDLQLKEVREVPTTMTTSSVTEPEPQKIDASSAADGSCASSVDAGEVQTYSPSSAESSTAESASSRKRSILKDLGF